MSELSEWAVRYLADGYHLLALRGKRPHTRYHAEWSWENSIHGLPTEPEHLAALYGCLDDPTVTGIAILIPEHVLVADIDTPEAAQLFREIVGDIPRDTAIARTTKGLHVWYVAPGAHGSRWLGDRALLFKGFGGYVAVEPSAHFTDDTLTEQDGAYTWVSPLADGLSFLPDAFTERFAVLDRVAELRPKKSDEDMVRFEVDGWNWHPTYALDGLANAIETAKDGNQNNVIYWAACVARDGGVPYEVCMETLLAAALRGKHPRSRAISSIKGAYKGRRG